MKSFRFYKALARTAIGGTNFLKAIIVFLLVSLLPNLITLLTSKINTENIWVIAGSILVLYLSLMNPFNMGAIEFLMNILTNKEYSVGNIFDGYKYILKLIPVSAVKFIPYLIMGGIAYLFNMLIDSNITDILLKYIEDPYGNIALLQSISDKDLLLIFLFEITFISAMLLIVLVDAYTALTPYILYDRQDLKFSGFKAVLMSIKMMKGHILYYIGLTLSFIPWHLASMITMGLIGLYATPYIEATRIVFYYHLKSDFTELKINFDDNNIS